MKVLLRGNFLEDIVPLLERKGFDIVDANPEIIVTYGGDGSLLGAEIEFPEIPKLPLRDDRTALLCKNHSHENILDDLLAGKLKKEKLIKLIGIKDDSQLIGMNDIFIHNVNRCSAIRYSVKIDDEYYLKEIASDCFGFATPHGSTAYYQSITGSIFRLGIGIAFSNSREHVNHIVIPDTSKIEIKIIRGPAFMVSDNNPEKIKIKTGDKIQIYKSETKADIYGLDAFMCTDCRKLRHRKC